MFLLATVWFLTLATQCVGNAVLMDYQNAQDLTTQFTNLSPPQIPGQRMLDMPVNKIYFFGAAYESIKIFESGVVSLKPCNAGFSTCPSPLKTGDETACSYIAVFWRHAVLQLGGKGRILFQNRLFDQNSDEDKRILSDTITAFNEDQVKETELQLSYLTIITWENVASLYNADRTLRNTFQLVIASDGINKKSFGAFLFKDIQYFAHLDQTLPCDKPAKVGIRNSSVSYWISNEVRLFEHGKRIPQFSNINPYVPTYLGRYVLRFFGSRIFQASQPLLFPRPAPALHQNCTDMDHPICRMNVPTDFCIGKRGEHPHPNLCSYFVYCDYDQFRGLAQCPRTSECPEGQSFNTHIPFCSCDNGDNCKGNSGSFYVYPTTFGDFTTPKLSVVVNCEYKPDGNYVNFDDCGSYWACSNKRNIKMLCPAGLKFNPVDNKDGGYEGYCDHANNVDCTRSTLRTEN